MSEVGGFCDVGTKGTVHNFGHIVDAYYRICSCPVKVWSSSCVHGIWNGSDSCVCPLFGNPNLRRTCEPSVSVNGLGNTKLVGVHARRRNTQENHRKASYVLYLVAGVCTRAS